MFVKKHQIIKGSDDYRQMQIIETSMHLNGIIQTPKFIVQNDQAYRRENHNTPIEIVNHLPRMLGIVTQVINNQLRVTLGDRSGQIITEYVPLGKNIKIEVLSRTLSPDQIASGTMEGEDFLLYQELFNLPDKEAIERRRHTFGLVINGQVIH